ncbi:MAG: hypothetical protein A4E53_00639 [Pelotomaculum sp. PtaB.Bin104]|nr:MAG: hypothetical protein A4E53_00639 [Pelotomaculum sp. PtaB.Bin104]
MFSFEMLLNKDAAEKKAAGRGAYHKSGRRGAKGVSSVILPFETIDRRREPGYRASRCICYNLYEAASGTNNYLTSTPSKG